MEEGKIWDAKRGFLTEALGMQKQERITGQIATVGTAEGQYGGTNLQTGSGQQTLQDIQKNFQLQMQQDSLAASETRFNLAQQEASRVRDIQGAGFDLDRYGASHGVKTGVGKSLLDMYNV